MRYLKIIILTAVVALSVFALAGLGFSDEPAQPSTPVMGNDSTVAPAPAPAPAPGTDSSTPAE